MKAQPDARTDATLLRLSSVRPGRTQEISESELSVRQAGNRMDASPALNDLLGLGKNLKAG